MQNESVLNIPDQPCSLPAARSFIGRISAAGLLEPPLMTHAAVGDCLILRNGAALKIHSIRQDESQSYPSFRVRFVGLACMELEYDGSGHSMDSEYAEEKPAPFDVVMLERTEIASLP